jgi:hypothetical protein
MHIVILSSESSSDVLVGKGVDAVVLGSTVVTDHHAFPELRLVTM